MRGGGEAPPVSMAVVRCKHVRARMEACAWQTSPGKAEATAIAECCCDGAGAVPSILLMLQLPMSSLALRC